MKKNQQQQQIMIFFFSHILLDMFCSAFNYIHAFHLKRWNMHTFTHIKFSEKKWTAQIQKKILFFFIFLHPFAIAFSILDGCCVKTVDDRNHKCFILYYNMFLCFSFTWSSYQVFAIRFMWHADYSFTSAFTYQHVNNQTNK